MLPPIAETARILIVDDEVANVRLLERILYSAGYRHVRSTTDSRQTLSLVASEKPDLILLDLHMPALNGFEVMKQLSDHQPQEQYLPILVLTADVTEETKQRALASGAKDFLTKPFGITEVRLRIRNLLEIRLLYSRLERQNRTLEEQVRERTEALEASRLEVVERLTQAAEFRDDMTGQHTQRVGEMSARIAGTLRLPEEDVERIRRAAPLHDAGKIGIPDAILLKPGSLTFEEFEVMKTHTTIGAKILSGGESALLRLAEEIALCHHERWDGTGYPRGLSGKGIPLAARIVAVADFFDALAHDRPYRAAWTSDRIEDEIRAQAGKHFDPDVVDAFFGTVRPVGSSTDRAAVSAATADDD